MFSPAIAVRVSGTESFSASASLKIGQVAAAAGLPVRTVRYYESLGLLKPTV
ncbi:MerR family transcriptional regulator, partial [Synechococcus sp. H55.4]